MSVSTVTNKNTTRNQLLDIYESLNRCHDLLVLAVPVARDYNSVDDLMVARADNLNHREIVMHLIRAYEDRIVNF